MVKASRRHHEGMEKALKRHGKGMKIRMEGYAGIMDLG
jgi:hypothetical protein